LSGSLGKALFCAADGAEYVYVEGLNLAQLGFAAAAVGAILLAVFLALRGLKKAVSGCIVLAVGLLAMLAALLAAGLLLAPELGLDSLGDILQLLGL
jgi:hypothetical protein